MPKIVNIVTKYVQVAFHWCVCRVVAIVRLLRPQNRFQKSAMVIFMSLSGYC